MAKNVKASARLVANVRGRGSDRPDPLYEDLWSRPAAGELGEQLGERVLGLLPEFAPMIEARTRCCDDALCESLLSGVSQVVTVGAGHDFRAFRFGPTHPEVRWFELDLPEMVVERELVLSGLALPDVTRYGLAMDLLAQDVSETLEADARFDREAPVFIIYEGCSMYFEKPQAERIFDNLAKIISKNPRSRLWIDLIHSDGILGKGGPETQAFMERMAQLGEPFVFGHHDPEELFGPLGLEVESHLLSNIHHSSENPLFSLYSFVTLCAVPTR